MNKFRYYKLINFKKRWSVENYILLIHIVYNKLVMDVKIAVASNDGIRIAKHFGKSQGFKIFEIKENKVINHEYRKNIGNNTGECHSCDHKIIVKNLSDCNIVISYGMGYDIYNDLIDNNIKPIVTEEETVKDAIKKFINTGLINRTDKLH